MWLWILSLIENLENREQEQNVWVQIVYRTKIGKGVTEHQVYKHAGYGCQTLNIEHAL